MQHKYRDEYQLNNIYIQNWNATIKIEVLGRSYYTTIQTQDDLTKSRMKQGLVAFYHAFQLKTPFLQKYW